MKQILGNNLSLAFEELGLAGDMKYKGNRYEVWEVSKEVFDRMCNIPEADWKDTYGWWRYGRCILQGNTLHEYTVNGQKLMAYFNDGLLDVLDELNEGEDDDDKLDLSDITYEEYSSFTDWLITMFHLSTERHIACFAISLASDNVMPLAEFMKKYEP